jgi:hypothetical protein
VTANTKLHNRMGYPTQRYVQHTQIAQTLRYARGAWLCAGERYEHKIKENIKKEPSYGGRKEQSTKRALTHQSTWAVPILVQDTMSPSWQARHLQPRATQRPALNCCRGAPSHCGCQQRSGCCRREHRRTRCALAPWPLLEQRRVPASRAPTRRAASEHAGCAPSVHVLPAVGAGDEEIRHPCPACRAEAMRPLTQAEGAAVCRSRLDVGGVRQLGYERRSPYR